MKTRIIDICTAVLIIIVLILFNSCRTTEKIIVRNDTIRSTVIRDRYRDTVITVMGDTSAINYLIDCQGDKARLVELLSLQTGKRTAPPQVVIRDRILSAKCIVDSAAVYMAWVERDTTRITAITNTPPPERVNYLTGWQWFQIWAGRILAGVVLIFCGVWYLKRKKPP